MYRIIELLDVSKTEPKLIRVETDQKNFLLRKTKLFFFRAHSNSLDWSTAITRERSVHSARTCLSLDDTYA